MTHTHGRVTSSVSLAAALLLAGCANPGPVRPPSLNLPHLATDVTAERWGSQVRLAGTVPTTTTDGLLLPGAQPKSSFQTKRHAHMGMLAAEVCREESGATECKPVTRMTVHAGQHATWEDNLPPQQSQGEPHILQYRIRILNAAGRSAGLSEAAAIATGDAPSPMHALAARATRRGAALTWAKATATAPGETIRIVRDAITPATNQPSANKIVAAQATKDWADLSVDSARDPGGAIDTGTKIGVAYRYTVYRLRPVVANGKALEVRGEAATVVLPLLTDTFPPPAPQNLVAIAIPADGTRKPAIDLSWEPVMEADLAGYFVYRADESATWSRVSPNPVTGTSYHDAAVAPGHRYQYRVTALDRAGNESKPSNVAADTVPATLP